MPTEMKRIYALAVIAGTAFFASMILNPAFDGLLKRLGKSEFYVYVVDAGQRSLVGNLSHQEFVYRVPAMDAHGTEKTLTFTSDKQLSLDTYVRLYVSSADEVTAWEEIPTQELPDRIKHGQLP